MGKPGVFLGNGVNILNRTIMAQLQSVAKVQTLVIDRRMEVNLAAFVGTLHFNVHHAGSKVGGHRLQLTA
ncbi:hypothetical protein D3C76_1473000 [compost metagenome]